MQYSTLQNLLILYEDNHLIVINKRASDLVQGDKTGDKPLVELVKEYLKIKYKKEGNVFLGVVHRLDRPTSGIVIFARTSKALSRLNQMFKNKEIKKTYWAIVQKKSIASQGTLVQYLRKNEKQNKSYVTTANSPGAKQAILHYRIIKQFNKYLLLEIRLETGRHHQIRCQLSDMGCPIVGDLKYHYPRSNPNGSICLHAREVKFIHPVKKEEINLTAPLPCQHLWNLVTPTF